MKFYNYINEEYSQSRSKKLSQDECIDYMKKNCKQAIKQYFKNNRIYRGSYGDLHSKFKLTTPTGDRKSSHTENYYTLVINNDPIWNKFPEREIICSHNINYASKYGILFNVFPMDDAKIGVCPKSDIWASFELWDSVDCFSLESLNRHIKEIFKFLNMKYKDLSFNELKDNMKKIPKHTIKHLLEVDVNKVYKKFCEQDEYDDFYDFYMSVVNPKNGVSQPFKVKTPKNFKSDYKAEVWLDSPCIMIDNIWCHRNEDILKIYFKGIL